MDSPDSTPKRRLRVAFFGTPDFSVFALQALLNKREVEISLVVTQPDRPAGRGGKLKASPVKELALQCGLAVYQPESIKKELSKTIEVLNEHGPYDLGVVSAFGQILPPQVLALSMAGCVNIHASLLPRWRGAAPIQRAIMAGDAMTGVCLMRMTEGLDTGPVYSRIEIPITEHDDSQSLHDKLGEAGAILLTRDMDQIASGKLIPVEQSRQGIEHAAKVTNEEAKINWSGSAQEVCRQIRGLSPWPGAFAMLGDSRVKIFRASPREQSVKLLYSNPEPGRVAFIDETRLEIFCGSGILSLEELQLEGRKRLPCPEFLRGANISSDCVLL